MGHRDPALTTESSAGVIEVPVLAIDAVNKDSLEYRLGQGSNWQRFGDRNLDHTQQVLDMVSGSCHGQQIAEAVMWIWTAHLGCDTRRFRVHVDWGEYR